MNTARKLVHEDVYKHLDQLEMKQTALLSDLILSSDESTLLVIGYWERKKLAADAAGIAVCNNQIDLLERRMMAKTILIEDLLNCVEITGGVPTVIGPEPLVNETKSVEELGDEKPVITMPVTEKAKAVMAEVEKKLETKEVKQDTPVIAALTDTPAIVVTERKNLDDIKAIIIPMIQANNEVAAKELYSAYMTKGMWLNKKGKAGNAMGAKEFATNWSDLLKKATPAPIPLATKTETAVEATTTPKSEVKETTTDTTTVAADEIILDDEKATLTMAEENLKSYKKFYPADSNAETNVLTFTKAILNVGEEEIILAQTYAKIINLFAEKKDKDAAELSRLFFSERAYSDAQVGKWMVAAAQKKEVKNHLQFLADAMTLRASDSVNDMIGMAITAVREDKTPRETIWDWVKRNVWNKKLTDRKEIIQTDNDFKVLWNAVFEYLFAPAPPRDPKDTIKAEEVISKMIMEAPKDKTLGLISVDARKELAKDNIKFSVKEMFSMTRELAKKLKPSIVPETVTGPEVDKKDEIKPNEAFDKPVPTENPTGPEPGKEESTSSDTKVTDTTDEIIEFKDLTELEAHLRYQYSLTKKYSAVLAEAVKYFITLNEIPDAKDWDLKKVEDYLKELVKPAKSAEETAEDVASKSVEVEQTNTDLHPATETGEPVATATETAAPVATVETAVEDKKKENTTSSTTKSSKEESKKPVFKPGFKGIHEAANKKQYETAVLEAFVNNKGDNTKGDSPENTSVLKEIISTLRTPGGGKYVQGIWKNKEEEQLKQIKKIVGLVEMPQTA